MKPPPSPPGPSIESAFDAPAVVAPARLCHSWLRRFLVVVLLLLASPSSAAEAAIDDTSLRGGGGALEEEGNRDEVQRRGLTPATAIDDTYIFREVGDGYATGQGDKVGTSCSTDDRRVEFVAVDNNDALDYMDITTTKWHSGGYRMDCKDKGSHTGWSCWSTCSPFPNPDFGDWTHLTFEAKVTNADDLAEGCGPTLGLTKRWPMHGSRNVPLSGTYVDGGVLIASEFRRVVVPVADFATDDWPAVDGVKDIYFRSCGTDFSTNPRYHVRDLKLTSDPPAIAAGPPETGSPTGAPSDRPTGAPSVSPTTAAPTASPSDDPSASPTEARWPIFESAEDARAFDLSPSSSSSAGSDDDDDSVSCFLQEERLGITTTTDPDLGLDYFTVRPDPWVSGGFRFGCVETDASYSCVRSCVTADGAQPDWSNKAYLTFEVQIEPGGCEPRVSLDGGGWPLERSHALALQGSYVDAGYPVPDEWRTVAIPMDDFETETWDLSEVEALHFLTCGTDIAAEMQPVYRVSNLAVTNHEIDVVSEPPSANPTPYVTDDFLLATHRWVHTNWYPVFGADREPEGRSWIVAAGDDDGSSWPVDVDGASPPPEPSSVTVLIPPGRSAVYSGSDSVVYDKIIVEGSLTIVPDGADVSLTVGTIVVERGGVLDVRTNGSGRTVEILIEGEVDRAVDPEEQLVGIISLEGNLTIAGDPVSRTTARLSEAVAAGSDVLRLDGAGFEVGGELVLPDTQTGLDVGHWNFANSGAYVDQTETCVIASIDEAVGDDDDDDETAAVVVTCLSPFAYDHAVGSTAAYTTRSVTVRTAPGSTDRGHILHTGRGKFDVTNARVEDLGRTTTDPIDSTVMAPDEGYKFPRDDDDDDDGEEYARMVVEKLGTNQIARYALHAHRSLVEARFEGNALLRSPRDGCVAHNSRVIIADNVVVGADGAGIFLEDGTETGPVTGNHVIGTGGGTRGGDDGRFSSSRDTDMAHGGFGIWARGKLAPILRNRCEGHFGVAPYAFFVHPSFSEDRRVPEVPGTPPELAGRLLREIPGGDDGDGQGPLQLQTHGGFVGNVAIGTFPIGIDLSYFSSDPSDVTGSVLEDATVVSLASSGRGISTTHSRIFTLRNVTLEAAHEENSVTGIWCNNCNGCALTTPNVTLTVEGVETVRGGNC